MTYNITAVIVSYNDYDTLDKCIESVLPQIKKIIVIDNSNIEGKPKLEEKIIYIKNKKNLGLAKALNIGIKESISLNSDWVLLLDQDSISDKNMIQNMISSFQTMKNKDEVAQVVPVVFDKNKKKYFPSYIFKKLNVKKVFIPNRDCFVDFHITSGTLININLLNNIGFMNEDFFIDYIDFDYCFRIREKGYKILLSKEAVLYHHLGKKSKFLLFQFIEHSSERIYYQVKNRIIVMKKYKSLYPSFVFKESTNLILKLFKIILIETNKIDKLYNYIKGMATIFRI